MKNRFFTDYFRLNLLIYAIFSLKKQ